MIFVLLILAFIVIGLLDDGSIPAIALAIFLVVGVMIGYF